MKIAAWSHPHREYPEGCDDVDTMRRRLEQLREAGLTVLFPFVAIEGAVYFESETLGPPERDLLAPLMAAASEVGVQVHPIMGLSGPIGPGRGLYRPPLDLADVPERAMSWPCPSWAENHERAVLVAGEIIEAYSPAGIHLDYCRYPNSELLTKNPCTCERCSEARIHWLGKPYPEPQDLRKPGVLYKELQMRAELVRSFVESMRGLTDQHAIELSAAVRADYYDDALVEGQDWAEWCADALIDTVCPMSYTLSLASFARLIAQHRRLLDGTPVEWLAGIGLQSSIGQLDLDAMDRQIQFAADAGASGVCIFHAGAIGDDELALLRRAAKA